MIRNLLILASTMFAAAAITWFLFNRGSSPTRFEGALRVGEKIPGEVLMDLGSNEFRLDSAAGRVVLVNFWASWCEPCAREFPSFLKLADTFGAKIFLVAIAIDTDRRGVENFLKAFDGNRSNIKILWDPSARSARRFGTDQYPETYIFDSKGILSRKMIGAADWSAEDSLALVRNLIGP